MDCFVLGDHHLGDAVSGLDYEGVLAEVQEDDFDFAAVGGVDGAGGVGDCDGVLEGEAGAGADLGLKAWGEFDREAGGYGVGLVGMNRDFFDAAEVHAGVFFGAVGVDGEFCVGVESLNFCGHGTITRLTRCHVS